MSIIASTVAVKAVKHVVVLSEQARWQTEKSRFLLVTSPTDPTPTDSVRTQPHRLCPQFTFNLISNSSLSKLLGVLVT